MGTSRALIKSWSQKARFRGAEQEVHLLFQKALRHSRKKSIIIGTWYISAEREIKSEWDLYYVLMIEHEGEIAHRVGLGKVFKKSLLELVRIWEA